MNIHKMLVVLAIIQGPQYGSAEEPITKYIANSKRPEYAQWLRFDLGTATVTGRQSDDERNGEIVVARRFKRHLENGEIRLISCRSTYPKVPRGDVFPVGNQLFKYQLGSDDGVVLEEVKSEAYATIISLLGDGFIACSGGSFTVKASSQEFADKTIWLEVEKTELFDGVPVFSGRLHTKLHKDKFDAEKGKKLTRVGEREKLDFLGVQFEVLSIMAPDVNLRIPGWV